MLTSLVLAVTLATPSLASPLDVPRACFTEHLVDAIEQNADRMAAYAWRTEGRSLQVSSSLIAGELALVPVALVFDAQALVLLGDDGLCPLFEPMSRARPHAVTTRAADLDLQALSWAIVDAARDEDFPAAARAIDVELVDARQGCMLRHTLESARRTARVAERADDDDVRALYARLLRLHAAGFVVVDDLDARAAALHLGGVPILCDDVPPISPLPASL